MYEIYKTYLKLQFVISSKNSYDNYSMDEYTSNENFSQLHKIMSPNKWLRSVILSFFLFLLWSFYEFIFSGTYTLTTAYHSMSDTAYVLIGLSLVLGSVAYFWNVTKSKIIYRKYLGVTGFVLIIFSGVISLFLLPELSPFQPYPFYNSKILPFFITIPAIVIYTVMALISNAFAIRLLGGKVWRIILRFGFLAFFLSTLHFSLKSYETWVPWFVGRQTLPPPSILLVAFGLFVLLLRIFVYATINNTSKETQPQTPSSAIYPTS